MSWTRSISPILNWYIFSIRPMSTIYRCYLVWLKEKKKNIVQRCMISCPITNSKPLNISWVLLLLCFFLNENFINQNKNETSLNQALKTEGGRTLLLQQKGKFWYWYVHICTFCEILKSHLPSWLKTTWVLLLYPIPYA